MTDKKLSIKWIEALLLIVILLVGLGLVTLTSSLVKTELELRRPREEAFIRNAQLPLRQSEATNSQADLTALRSKIMEQQVELTTQSAKLEALKSNYPALNTVQDLAAEKTIKDEVKTTFTQLQIDIDATRRSLNALNAGLPALTQLAIQKSIDLNAAQETMHREFEEAQERFGWFTHWITFLVSIGLSLLVIVIADRFVRYLNLKEQLGIRPKFVRLSGLAIMLVLTSYQSFESAGATLAVVGIALIASTLAMRSLKEGGEDDQVPGV